MAEYEQNGQMGQIEVICGSMFCGKTEELIRRIKRAIIIHQKVILFKPKKDNRFSKNEIVSHSGIKIKSLVINKASEILELVGDAQVVGIDEAQFFSNELVKVCQILARKGKRVIIAGLDMTFDGNPFGPIPELLAIADFIKKLKALCAGCGAPAHFSFRITESKEKIVVGAKKDYEARCRKCYQYPENYPK